MTHSDIGRAFPDCNGERADPPVTLALFIERPNVYAATRTSPQGGSITFGGHAMAGYSGTPLHKKLGMKEGHRVALYGEPPDFLDLIGPASKALAISRRPRSGRFSVIVFFTKSAALLQKALPQLKSRMEPAAGLWIAWPKKASGVKTDVTEDTVRAFGLAAGLVDNKVCAIDETWSGLRLVIRVKDRARV